METMKSLILLLLFFCTCHGVWECNKKGDEKGEKEITGPLLEGPMMNNTQNTLIVNNGTETRSLWNIGKRAPECDYTCRRGRLCYHSLIRYTCEDEKQVEKGEYITIGGPGLQQRFIYVAYNECFKVYKKNKSDPGYRVFKAGNKNICWYFATDYKCTAGIQGSSHGKTNYDILGISISSHDAKENNCGKRDFGAPYNYKGPS